VNEPIPKLEGQSQCSGEAQYVNDMPSFPGELTAIFVMATIANCDIDTIDASAALVSSNIYF
jgi:xanthine dehydrogenase/oxidase